MGTIKKFSIGGVVGIGIGLIGMGFQWKYPEQGWIGKWVAILGIVVIGAAIIASIVRWLTIKEFEKQQQRPAYPYKPMAEARGFSGGIHIPINVGTIHQTAEQQIDSTQKHLAEKPFAQPHLEFTNPEVADRWINEYGCLVKEEPQLKLPPLSVMLARFYYKPDADVPPGMKLKAHISIANSEGVPIKARYDAVWDGVSDSEYKWFATAETHALVIVLVPFRGKHK